MTNASSRGKQNIMKVIADHRRYYFFKISNSSNGFWSFTCNCILFSI